MPMNEGKSVQILKASRMLQAKTGTGNFSREVIEKSQKAIDETEVDFVPMAMAYLEQLGKSIEEVEKGADKSRDAVESLVTPVMQIKANAAMLHYPLIGKIATIVLNFLETLQGADEDVLDIARACENTLTLIVTNRMQGDGGAEGEALQKELKDACKRYYVKNSLEALEG
jgi:prophage DNA circulation protein